LLPPFPPRTQKKDSQAAPKSLSFNDFSHFAESAELRDLTVGHAAVQRHCVGRAFARLRKPA
jgi:hypothetical protein